MFGTYSLQREIWNAYRPKMFVENLKRRDHLEDIGKKVKWSRYTPWRRLGWEEL
jgi:hypothetical protein